MSNNQNLSDKKPSFLLYKSFYDPIKDLTDEDFGKLLRAIFNFQIDRTEIELPANLKMAFGFFKNQFLVDEVKYELIVERNAINGSKGGRGKKKNQTNPKNPVGLKKPKKADIEKETGIGKISKDIGNELEIDSKDSQELFDIFWQYYTPIKINSGKFVEKGSKKVAQIAFDKTLNDYRFEDILQGLKQYLIHCKQNDTLSCQASVFLNQERFLNEYDSTPITSDDKSDAAAAFRNSIQGGEL